MDVENILKWGAIIMGVATLATSVLGAVVPMLSAAAKKTKTTADDKVVSVLTSVLSGLTLVMELVGKVTAVLAARKPSDVKRAK